MNPRMEDFLHKRRKRFSITLVLLRLISIPIVLLLILKNKLDIALILFIIFPLVGFFDNLIEKYGKLKSLLRKMLDFFADKLLIDAVSIALWYMDLFPIWAMMVYVLRDTITYLGTALFVWKDKPVIIKPMILGKFTLFLQLISLALALNEHIDYPIIWLSVIITIASLIHILFRSEIITLNKGPDFEGLKLARLISPASVLTLVNVLFGFTVILFSINKQFLLASIMLLLAVVSDFFDGKLARALKKESDFGKELDSLADTISFGVAPAIFGFSLVQSNNGFNPIQTKLAIATFIIFVFCGILRLARYNISDLKGTFQGMPITVNGIIIPVLYFFNFPTQYYPYVFLILALLMIAPIKVSRL